MSERPAGNGDSFQPRIVAFFCNWCTYTAVSYTHLTLPTNREV